MSGFFGFFDYAKPGPGVSKDEPPKSRLKVFFEVYFRKFWKLMSLNMMYFVFNIPAMLVLVALNLVQSKDVDELYYRIILTLIFVAVPIITVGPAQAGFTYVLRNFSREEHAFLWGDFKDAAMKNFKESVIISLIDLVVVLLASFSFSFYLKLSSQSIWSSFAIGLMLISFVIFLMMHMYIYPMLVTFKLKVKQIYMNALLFSLHRFLPNLLILIICAAVLFGTFLALNFVAFFLLPFITLSLIGFITNFYVYPSIKKHMMDKLT